MVFLRHLNIVYTKRCYGYKHYVTLAAGEKTRLHIRRRNGRTGSAWLKSQAALIIHPGRGVERVEEVFTLVLDLLVGLSFLGTKPHLGHGVLESRHVALILVGEVVDFGPLESSGRGKCFLRRWRRIIVFVVAVEHLAFAPPVCAARTALLECRWMAASDCSAEARLAITDCVTSRGVDRDERRFARLAHCGWRLMEAWLGCEFMPRNGVEGGTAEDKLKCAPPRMMTLNLLYCFTTRKKYHFRIRKENMKTEEFTLQSRRCVIVCKGILPTQAMTVGTGCCGQWQTVSKSFWADRPACSMGEHASKFSCVGVQKQKPPLQIRVSMRRVRCIFADDHLQMWQSCFARLSFAHPLSFKFSRNAPAQTFQICK